MIVDGLVALLAGFVQTVISPLPAGNLSLPSGTGVGNVLGGLDSMVPILAPLQLALTMLAAVVAFITVRVVLVVINIIWP